MEKISSGNLYPFGITHPKHIRTFHFPQETISHTLKQPHSKALEPDCLGPGLAITTQPQKADGWRSRRKEVVSTDLTDKVSRVGHEKEDGPWASTREKLEKVGSGGWIPRQCEGGMRFSLSASCTSSAREPACIFFITRARWSLTVFSTIPSSRAICLFSLPVTTR